MMAILVAALCAGVVAAGVVGAAGLSLGEAFRAFVGLIRDGTDATGGFPEWAPRLLFNLRLPRIDAMSFAKVVDKLNDCYHTGQLTKIRRSLQLDRQ